MYVLALDRDWTIDSNPHPNRAAVPLDWVQFWAHETDHEVWAIGNQDLVYEAGIPGVVEAVKRQHGNLEILGEQGEDGYYESWPSREHRLELLAELFPDAHTHFVIDDLDLSHVDGWEHYHAWEFVEEVQDGPLSLTLLPPSNESGESSEENGLSEHAESIRQQLRTANEVEIVIDDEDQETFRSRSWEKLRPSSIPIDSPPMLDFTTTANMERRVRVPDILDITVLEELAEAERDTDDEDSEYTMEVEHPNPSVVLRRANQAGVLTTNQRIELAVDILKISNSRTVLPRKQAELFADEVEDVSAENASPAALMSEYLIQHPSILADYTEELCKLSRVSDQTVRRRSAWCLMDLADGNPGAVIDAVPTLEIVLDNTDEKMRKYATYTLSCIAGSYPEEVVPTLQTLLDQIGDEDQGIKTNTLATVGKITSSYPDAAERVADKLAGLLDDDPKRIRNNAVGLLADIAQQHPGIVIEYAGPIAELLTDPNIQARINASIALLAAGEADPEIIRAHHEYLERALDDPSPEVRANSCTLIANTKAPVPIERLRDLRENDLDETVRERAGWAVSQLP